MSNRLLAAGVCAFLATSHALAQTTTLVAVNNPVTTGADIATFQRNVTHFTFDLRGTTPAGVDWTGSEVSVDVVGEGQIWHASNERIATSSPPLRPQITCYVHDLLVPQLTANPTTNADTLIYDTFFTSPGQRFQVDPTFGSPGVPSEDGRTCPAMPPLVSTPTRIRGLSPTGTEIPLIWFDVQNVPLNNTTLARFTFQVPASQGGLFAQDASLPVPSGYQLFASVYGRTTSATNTDGNRYSLNVYQTIPEPGTLGASLLAASLLATARRRRSGPSCAASRVSLSPAKVAFARRFVLLSGTILLSHVCSAQTPPTQRLVLNSTPVTTGADASSFRRNITHFTFDFQITTGSWWGSTIRTDVVGLGHIWHASDQRVSYVQRGGADPNDAADCFNHEFSVPGLAANAENNANSRMYDTFLASPLSAFTIDPFFGNRPPAAQPGLCPLPSIESTPTGIYSYNPIGMPDYVVWSAGSIVPLQRGVVARFTFEVPEANGGLVVNPTNTTGMQLFAVIYGATQTTGAPLLTSYQFNIWQNVPEPSTGVLVGLAMALTCALRGR